MWLQTCLSQWNRKGSAGVGGIAGIAMGVNFNCHRKVVHLTKYKDEHMVIVCQYQTALLQLVLI